MTVDEPVMDDYIQPLRKVQIEILDEIDRVCQKNGQA